jgi:glutamate-1-semialdehyde 2,1-aminomutase
LKFEGCYHGHADSLLVKAGSGLAGRSAADSAGVPQAIAEQTFTCPLDDETAVEKIFRDFGSQIAAVIVEPLPANYGLLVQRPEFLKQVAALARANGALLILDEVISGFRVGFGGMAERLDIKPDLVTYGKIIGGGLAVGAYAGRADLMDLVAPAGPVYQAGTLSANPLAMRTGLATLNKIESARVYEILEKRTAGFAFELKKVLAPIDFDVTHYASLFWLHPKSDRAVRSLKQLPENLGEKYSNLFQSFLHHGIYLAPSGYEVGFVSLAHNEEILNEALKRMREAVSEL